MISDNQNHVPVTTVSTWSSMTFTSKEGFMPTTNNFVQWQILWLPDLLCLNDLWTNKLKKVLDDYSKENRWNHNHFWHCTNHLMDHKLNYHYLRGLCLGYQLLMTNWTQLLISYIFFIFSVKMLQARIRMVYPITITSPCVSKRCDKRNILSKTSQDIPSNNSHFARQKRTTTRTRLTFNKPSRTTSCTRNHSLPITFRASAWRFFNKLSAK